MEDFVYADFIAAFPQFADTTKYPESSVQFWAALGAQVTSFCAWGDSYMAGIYLFIAHELTLEGRGANGGNTGLVANKAVGSASIGYDTSNTAEAGAGYYNLTVFGQRYWRMVRLFGAGAVQV